MKQIYFPKINYVLDKLKAARYVGVGLGLANVTLDAFEYSYAQDRKTYICHTAFIRFIKY